MNASARASVKNRKKHSSNVAANGMSWLDEIQRVQSAPQVFRQRASIFSLSHKARPAL